MTVPRLLKVFADGYVGQYLGSSAAQSVILLLHGSLEGSGVAITASLSGIHQLPRTEETLKLAVDPANVYLFDKTTGRRIDSK